MIKITKNLAKKMYDNGEAIAVVPSKVRPKSQLFGWMTKPANDPNATFEKLCETVFYYNCSPETGMTLTYYAKEL